MICKTCEREIGENEICPYCYATNFNKSYQKTDKIYDYEDFSLEDNQYLEEMTLENFGKHIGGFLYTDYGAVFVYKSNGCDFIEKINISKKTTNLFYVESIILLISFLLINIFSDYPFVLQFFVLLVGIILFFIIASCYYIKDYFREYLKSKDEIFSLCVFTNGINLFNDKNKEFIIDIPKEQIKEFCIKPVTILGIGEVSYKLCIKSNYDILKKNKKCNNFKEKFFDLGIHIDDKNKLLFLKQEFEKILGISDKTYYLVKEDNNTN